MPVLLRFLLGTGGGAVAGAVAAAVPHWRPYWWLAALVVACLIWFGEYILD